MDLLAAPLALEEGDHQRLLQLACEDMHGFVGADLKHLCAEAAMVCCGGWVGVGDGKVVPFASDTNPHHLRNPQHAVRRSTGFKQSRDSPVCVTFADFQAVLPRVHASGLRANMLEARSTVRFSDLVCAN